MTRKFGLTAAAVGLVAGLSISTAMADVKFGALFPLSGELALLGEESFRGVELAVEEKNAAGGVKKEKITLVRGDAVDNNQAIGEARRLISVEKVKAIFGTYSSARSVAATQVAELARVPYFELVAVSDQITTRGFRYVFRTNPSSSDFGDAALGAITNLIAPALGVDAKSLKVGIIHEDGVFGSSVGSHQVAAAKAKGFNVVQVMPYPASTVDMSAIVLRLRESGVDVVLHTAYEKDSILFLKQAKELGFKPKAVIGAGGGHIMQPVADAVGHSNIEDVIAVAESNFDVNPAAAPGLDKFIAAYKAKYGTDPRGGMSLISYVGTMAVLQALDGAKSFEPDEIRDRVKAIDIPAGSTAAAWGVKFNEKGQNERAQMLVMQWQNGKLRTVFPEKAAVAKFKLAK